MTTVSKFPSATAEQQQSQTDHTESLTDVDMITSLELLIHFLTRNKMIYLFA